MCPSAYWGWTARSRYAGITMPVTKHNYIVKDVRELADTVREAFYIANEAEKVRY